MTREPTGRILGRAALCGAKPITCMGMTFTPDPDRAYVEFTLSHSLPVTTYQGGAIHPGTVFNSYQSLLHKNLNLGHILRAYNPDADDQALGSVVAVEWQGPQERPAGGFAIAGKRSEAPGIRGVAVLHKTWQFSGAALEMRNPTVSMEVTYILEQSAFGLLGKDGWNFVPYKDAPKELRDCWVQPEGKNGYMAGTYQGVKPVMLWNGVDSTVRYLGLALVTLGYEAEASVERVLAGELDPAGTDQDPAWAKLAQAIEDLV